MNEPIKEKIKDIKKPNIFQYLRLRIGMKLYKWGIIKGWDMDCLTGKVYFSWFK